MPLQPLKSVGAIAFQRSPAPQFTTADAERIVLEQFGLGAICTDLSSYIDRNFLAKAKDGSRWVLRIANDSEQRRTLDLQNRAMLRVGEAVPEYVPTVKNSVSGRGMERVKACDGREHWVRLVSFLPGELMSEASNVDAATWRGLGELLGKVDLALVGFEHDAADRELRWDLAFASWTVGASKLLTDPTQRALVEAAQVQYFGLVERRWEELPKAWIHNDANDQNLVLSSSGPAAPRVSGLFDFGDLVYSARIFELSVACAYALFDCEDPLEVMGQLCAGYNEQIPLQEVEIEALLPATAMRLVQSVTIAAQDSGLDPDNEYIRSSESGAWKGLQALAEIDPVDAAIRLREACNLELGLASGTEVLGRKQILQARGEHLGPSLSLSYKDSIEIVRGRGAWLFDAGGRAYLDGVNNVCHVGHCHPHVVAAGQQQMGMLNTNTRYLHQNIARYAKRLTGLFPEHLSVCFFVNSGSEANELAIRMARNFTGRRNILSLDGGYHGNTSTMVDISPYKHDGPGGAGAPDWLTTVACPDTYRGKYRANDPEAAVKYAQEIADACERAAERNSGYAALIAEPLIGCGGQIVPPHGYLRHAFEHAREAGALCIADEVQIGFGRVGESWWGFQLDDARPDIVTLGKPIGNGHPMAAVITTPEIAASFANGMEYFNTFGGNPVSCAIGMAVLDVIESEGLLQRACELGQRFRDGFRRLAEHHECIGDVRGVGLFLGVEIVKDRQSREPDAQRLAQAIERARQAGILFSSDGPHHNVLKIKPPMCWTQTEVDLALAVMDGALRDESSE